MYTPKVSVLVPVYNVERYLRECFDSLVGQTMADLEIIAINDGSTDSSLEILREYAQHDGRIRILDKPNSGYGDSMNQGLAQVHGTYVGIVESDDYIELDMYEKLVAAAESCNADLVKCNYFERVGRKDSALDLYAGLDVPYGQPVDPREHPRLATVRPCLWAALYRADYLREACIDFAPRPGASFQDTSFYFESWFAAHRVVILREPLLHYRIDSAGSSKTAKDKVFAGNDEFQRALDFLEARGQGDLRIFGPVLGAMWFGCLVWHYNRMAAEHRLEFAQRWSQEMRGLFERDLVDLDALMPASQNDLHLLMAEPSAFCVEHAHTLAWPGFTYEHPDFVPPLAGAPLHVVTHAPERPDVSVIVPFYGVQDYVRDCMESLLAQTHENFEVLCVNDGSPDNTAAIARSAARGDARFRWFEQRNAGQSAARNHALCEAHGEYVMFVDSDDFLEPCAIEHLLGVARRNGLDYLDFTARTFYESERVPRNEYEERYSQRHDIPGVMSGPQLFVSFQRLGEYFCPVWLHFAKRSLIGELRFPEGIIHEDELFSPLLIARAQAAAYVNEPLYVRRMREGSAIAIRRGIRNVACLFRVVCELQDWLADHAVHLDADFASAFADRIAFLRGILATDAELAGTAALDAFEAGLGSVDRARFRLDVRGALAIRQRALSDAQATRDFKLGHGALAAPRALKSTWTSFRHRNH